jgi:hypothetical protein
MKTKLDKATLKRMGWRPRNRIWHTFKTIYEVTQWIEMLECYLQDFERNHDEQRFECAQELMDIRADWKAMHFHELPCCLPDDTCMSCSHRINIECGDY